MDESKYFLIPGYPDYKINILGDIKDHHPGEDRVHTTIRRLIGLETLEYHNQKFVNLLNQNRRRDYRLITRLLLDTFSPSNTNPFTQPRYTDICVGHNKKLVKKFIYKYQELHGHDGTPWRTIPGISGYLVSNNGHLINLAKWNGEHHPFIFRPMHPMELCMVTTDDGEIINRPIMLLLAMAFLPCPVKAPLNKIQVKLLRKDYNVDNHRSINMVDVIKWVVSN